VTAVGDDRLETLDEEDDVDRIALRGGSIGSDDGTAFVVAGLSHGHERLDAGSAPSRV